MQVSAILDNIDRGGLSLPMFQRGYVWTRPQVKNMMESLYRGYPVGGLLLWETRVEDAAIRGSAQVSAAGTVSLLLDGQQRVTTLYGIVRGTSPPFFEGDAKAFTDLYFNLDSEEFEFRSPLKMALDNRWVDVTRLFEQKSAAGKYRELLNNNAYTDEQLDSYMARAQRILNVQNTDFPVQVVTGEDKTTDVVAGIFNSVNSGGRKLSRGDLALASIGAQWPEVRDEMQKKLDKWSESANFTANRDWLLRCVTALVRGTSEFERLTPVGGNVPIAEIRKELERAEPAIDTLLEATRTYLGMDTDKVHNSKQAFPAMVKYLVSNGGDFPNDAAKAQLLGWYISASIWGRFSGPTETIINQDLAALQKDDPFEALQQNLVQAQGNRMVGPENFNFNRSSARFYPLLHIMSRVGGARDWGTGKALPDHEPGPDMATELELHHIFPKAYLRKHGVSANDANNFGNLAFQTRDTNRGIGNRPPSDYMPEVAAHQPGALESQWVPTDPDLWKVENYPKFLAERRRLLAKAANEFMESLRAGNLPAAASGTVSKESDDDEGAILTKLSEFAVQSGLPAGELGHEVFDASDKLTATLDLAWPNGLQDGLSEPVAVLIGETDAVINAAFNAGFRHVFTSPDGEDFMYYVRHKILGEDEESEDESGDGAA